MTVVPVCTTIQITVYSDELNSIASLFYVYLRHIDIVLSTFVSGTWRKLNVDCSYPHSLTHCTLLLGMLNGAQRCQSFDTEELYKPPVQQTHDVKNPGVSQQEQSQLSYCGPRQGLGKF
jgi:hypothetical protein